MIKRISLLLALCLLFTACISAPAEDAGESYETETAGEEADELTEPEEPGEEYDGDDSVQIPLEIPESEEENGNNAVELRPLQPGDEGDDVLFLQMRLESLGYFSGEADGKYGDKTQEAVKQFQIDYAENGLEVTGMADIATQLMAVNAQYRGLRYGSEGEDVKELQTQLSALGYYKGQISGKFLEGTKNAIKQLQKYNGMEQTGVAAPALQDFIYSGNVIGRYDDEEDTATPTPNLDAYYLVNENENGVPMPDEPVVFAGVLKSGITGSEQVTQLQERMRQLGYYSGPVSGNFKNQTAAAVKKIQKQNGMEATGVVDETTWNLIFNNPGIVMPDQEPKPTPKPEYAITVDVRNQIVTVYGLDEENEYTVAVRYMLCSSGKVGTPTPVGDWVLNGKKAKWCYFPKWGDYARYWTRINAQVAFHSPIYYSASNDAMNTTSYKMLGNRASHGCVRLTVADAKWIYDNVGAGTVVSVRENLPVDKELKSALLHDKPSTPNGSAPANTPEPEYSKDNRPVIKGSLSEGSHGEDVYWVQRRLKELGYYRTKCTGQMKNRTVQAVKDFQKDHGFRPNGYVNQELIDAMAEAEKITPTPAPAQ